MYQIIENLNSVIHQLYLNKTEKKKEMQILMSSFVSIESETLEQGAQKTVFYQAYKVIRQIFQFKDCCPREMFPTHRLNPPPHPVTS